jgi:RNA polymerase sigma-70 factor (ECF subfamily)
MTDPHDPAALPAPLADGVGRNWRGFLEHCEPLRPELYRYSRYLTRSPWEADDLVQDTLMRAFVALGCAHQEIRNPRAWLLRIASNLWLNRVRDARELPSESSALLDGPDPQPVDPQATREAAGSLLVLLSPQERAAVVLKDVFELSLEDTAEALSTSVGAVKAALSRGRGKLSSQPEPSFQQAPAPAVLEAFCAAFNARDLERVTALLLEHAINEFPGLSLEYGAEAAKRGSLAGVLFGDPSSDRSGIAPQFRRGLLASPPRLELRTHRGEGLLLAWFAHDDGEAVRGISRVSVVGDRIAHMRTYLHQPEVLAELCTELAVPFRSNGYRYWW